METVRYNDGQPINFVLTEEDLFDLDRMRDIARRMKADNVKSITLTRMKHVKENDRCPCGGRLKFKRCCKKKYDEMKMHAMKLRGLI